MQLDHQEEADENKGGRWRQAHECRTRLPEALPEQPAKTQ
jgi:hypothetical protein